MGRGSSKGARVKGTQAAAVSIFLFALAGAACDREGVVSVAPGEWGGTNVELLVTDNGASATFKCGAVGRLVGPLMVDGSGRFDASGTYEPKLVQGGPRPARYSGSLNGMHLTLQVQVANDASQTFELTEGQPAAFDPCNY
jgi:hypothetical protein